MRCAVKYSAFSIDLAGHLSAAQELDTSELALGRLQSLQGLFKRHRNAGRFDFVRNIPGQNTPRLSFRMTAEKFSAGVITLFVGPIPAMISAVVTGADRAADDYVLRSLENFLIVLPTQTAAPPNFDLARVKARPAVVSVSLPVPSKPGFDPAQLDEWNKHCAASLMLISLKDAPSPAVRDAS